MEIFKTYEFSAAHHLPNHEGKCKSTHGHEWTVTIGIQGFSITEVTSPERGMVMDYHTLSNLVDPLIEILDHKYLNHLTFHGQEFQNPTCENLVNWFGDKLTRALESDFSDCGGRLFGLRITIQEGNGGSCTETFSLFPPKTEDFNVEGKKI